MLYYGGVMVSAQQISVGNLTSFLLYAAYIGVSVGGLSSFYSEFNKSLGAATKLWELIDREPSIPPQGKFPLTTALTIPPTFLRWFGPVVRTGRPHCLPERRVRVPVSKRDPDLPRPGLGHRSGQDGGGGRAERLGKEHIGRSAAEVVRSLQGGGASGRDGRQGGRSLLVEEMHRHCQSGKSHITSQPQVSAISRYLGVALFRIL